MAAATVTDLTLPRQHPVQRWATPHADLTAIRRALDALLAEMSKQLPSTLVRELVDLYRTIYRDAIIRYDAPDRALQLHALAHAYDQAGVYTRQALLDVMAR